MRVTDFNVVDSRGKKIDADPFGNNIAFACFSCKHPVLAIARKYQRGNSEKNPAACRVCGKKYFIESVDCESEDVTIASIDTA